MIFGVLSQVVLVSKHVVVDVMVETLPLGHVEALMIVFVVAGPADVMVTVDVAVVLAIVTGVLGQVVFVSKQVVVDVMVEMPTLGQVKAEITVFVVAEPGTVVMIVIVDVVGATTVILDPMFLVIVVEAVEMEVTVMYPVRLSTSVRVE